MLLRSAPATPTSTRVDRHARSGRHTPRALAAALNPSCGSGTATPLKPERSQRDDVQVVVRVRPATDGGGCVVVHSDERSLSIRLPSAPGPMGKSRSYTFDQAFDPATTQAEVFEVVGAPLVDSVLDGFNATIFAYGQTGSGKTYTMHGGDSQHGSHGLMLRAVEALFEGMERRAPDVSFRASCTYMQIYNEVCTDCLAPVSTSLPGAMAPPLRVREDGARVHVEGLRRAPLEGLADAERLLALGAAHRTVGATSTNAASSRSHAIFSVSLAAELRGADGLVRERLTSLHLVDLAGA